ncbi:MAG: type II secretion system protein [Alphaproteobacteria bacterium]|nr:type II secretion system protein [Alphaproteobacteria bacterium]
MKKNNQYGRSMMEMLGVLTIIGILTTGGFGLVMKTRMHQAINEVTDTMTSLAQKTRHIIRDYQLDIEDGATSDDLNVYVKKANAYPDTLATDWTDRNDVTYDVVYVGTNPMFWVVVSGLSEEMCLSLSNGNYGNSNSSGFVGLSYGSDETIHNSPVDLGTAVTGCTPERGSTTVTMKFGFR